MDKDKKIKEQETKIAQLQDHIDHLELDVETLEGERDYLENKARDEEAKMDIGIDRIATYLSDIAGAIQVQNKLIEEQNKMMKQNIEENERIGIQIVEKMNDIAVEDDKDFYIGPNLN